MAAAVSRLPSLSKTAIGRIPSLSQTAIGRLPGQGPTAKGRFPGLRLDAKGRVRDRCCRCRGSPVTPIKGLGFELRNIGLALPETDKNILPPPEVRQGFMRFLIGTAPFRYESGFRPCSGIVKIGITYITSTGSARSLALKLVLRRRNNFFRLRLHESTNPNCGSGSGSSPGSE